MLIPKTSDGRVLFAVPWHDRVIFGTTDTPVTAPSLEPRPLRAEIEFLMAYARQFFLADISVSDVCSVYSGLRPLVRRTLTNHTKELARDHSIVISESGLLTVAGGKWTTYRRMAADAVDHVEDTILQVPRKPCRTAQLKIHGWSHDESRSTPYLAPYGADASEIEVLSQSEPELRELIHPSFPHQRAEVIWQVRHEMARRVEDILARRTRMLIQDARASIAAAETVARLIAQELQRDESWVQMEIDDYRALAEGYLLTELSLC